MDKYSVSQTPTGKKPVKKKKAAKAPVRKQTRKTDPKLAIIAVVAIIAAIALGGIVYAQFFANKEDPAAQMAAASQKRAEEKGVVEPEIFDGVTNAISSKNASDLKKYYAKKVRIIIPSKSVNQTVSNTQVGNFVDDLLNTAQTPWNWHVSPEQLAAWQQGPYGENFVGNVIVGISPDNTVIAIHIDENGDIDSIFIAPVGDLTNPPPSETPPTPTPDSTPPAPDPVTPFSTDDSD